MNDKEYNTTDILNKLQSSNVKNQIDLVKSIYYQKPLNANF